MSRATSVYLDLVRLMAALLVVIVHANEYRFTGGLPLLWRLSDSGNDAVMIFFVLSGLVIAWVADTKERELGQYLLSRCARLWSVALPALLLTVLLDSMGTRLAPEVYDGPWFQASEPLARLLLNALFMNELWFTSVRPFSNGPFWSLGYEFWYYVLFALIHLLDHPRKYILLALVCLLVGPKILLLAPVWAMGVWTYRRINSRPVGERLGWLLWLGSIGVYGGFRAAGIDEWLLDCTLAWFGAEFTHGQLAWSKYFLGSYVIGALVSAHFLGFAAIAHRFTPLAGIAERPIRHGASYTFSIYLFHYPLLQFFTALLQPFSNTQLRAAMTLLLTGLAIWVLGGLTERRKHAFKQALVQAYSLVGQRLAYSALRRSARGRLPS